MATDAVIKKLEYLQRCLREGPLAGSDDADTRKLLDFLSSDMLQTPDEERALSSHMIRFMETFLLLRGQPIWRDARQFLRKNRVPSSARLDGALKGFDGPAANQRKTARRLRQLMLRGPLLGRVKVPLRPRVAAFSAAG